MLSTLGAKVALALIALALLPFLLSNLGKEGYGLYRLASSLSAMLLMLDLGIGSAGSHFIAKALGQGKKEQVNELFSATFVFFLCAGVVALIVGVLIALVGVDLFHPPSDLRWVVQVLFLVAALQAWVLFVRVPFHGLLLSLQLHSIANLLHVGVLLLRAAVIVAVFTSAGHGLIRLILIDLGIAVIQAILMILLSYRFLPSLRIRIFKISRATVGMLFGYSSAVLLDRIVFGFRGSAERFVAAITIGPAAVTVFDIGWTLVEQVRRVYSVVIPVLSPVASKYFGREDTVRLRILFLNGSRILWSLVLCIVIPLALFGRNLIVVWLGPEYLDSLPVLYVLLLGQCLDMLRGTSAPLMYGTENVWKSSIHSTIGFVLGMVVAIASVKVFGFGVVGVAMGFVCSSLYRSVAILHISCRLVGVSRLAFGSRVLFRPILGHIPTVVVGYLAVRYIDPDSWPTLLGSGAVTGLVALGCTWALSFSREDREHAYSAFRRRKSVPVPEPSGDQENGW